MNPIHPRHAFNPRILWTYVFFQSHTSFFSTHAYFQRTHPHAPCPSPSFIIIVDVGMIWPWKFFYVALEFGNRELPRFLSLCLWLSNFENIYHIASYAVSLAVFRPWFQNFVLATMAVISIGAGLRGMKWNLKCAFRWSHRTFLCTMFIYTTMAAYSKWRWCCDTGSEPFSQVPPSMYSGCVSLFAFRVLFIWRALHIIDYPLRAMALANCPSA